jgi:peroxiredoxin Q/BCP
MLEINDSAPDFNLLNQDGKKVSLRDFKDKNVVIYFYPRANTPGCITEACGFRDDWSGFKKENISVIGISDDPVKKIAQFHKKYDLNFDLLSDENGEMSRGYNAYGGKNMFGKKFMGVKRSTYIVCPHGKILSVYSKVKVAEHAKQILIEMKDKKCNHDGSI